MVEHCPSCHGEVTLDSLQVCPLCGHYFPLTVDQRIALVADEGSFVEMASDLQSGNPIRLERYEAKLKENQKKSSLQDAATIGRCTIGNRPAILGIMSFSFMGGSMGSVVGEKITQAILEGALSGDP